MLIQALSPEPIVEREEGSGNSLGDCLPPTQDEGVVGGSTRGREVEHDTALAGPEIHVT